MKRNIYLLCTLICFGAANFSYSQTVKKKFKDGELYLKFKNEATFTLPDYPANSLLSYPENISPLIKQFDIVSIKKAFPRLKSTELQHTYKILFRKTDQTDSLIKALNQLPYIDYVEKVPVRRKQFTPNDPDLPAQYAPTNIQAYNAWNLCKGSKRVKIAIVDDAIKLNHQDLSANRWINTVPIAGYPGAVNGYDVADNDPDPDPPSSATNSFDTHGTHCAGIADAVTDNGLGIASIGYGLSLMGVKCNPDTATDNEEIYDAIQGVEFAIAANANVVSMSWGGEDYSSTEQNVFNEGWAQGMIFVAAAGNSSSDALFYPAAYDHIVSVGATDNTDAIASFSDYGTWVSVMAPGVNIFSTLAGSDSSYGYLSGTSMATPMVAGLCGLIESYDSLLTNAQVISCLESSCDNIDAQNPGYEGQLGAGRINAAAALFCVNPTSPPVAEFTAPRANTCSGIIQFTDQSLFNPDKWIWYFGDGDTSHEENPVHQYTVSNTYTVKLVVSNSNGKDSLTQADYISISLPTPPSASGVSVCEGDTATLTATGNDTMYWYNAPTGGSVVGIGKTIKVGPELTSKTYYVESDVSYPIEHTIPHDSSFGSGSVFTNTNYHDLVFDCYTPLTLLSVLVYAQGGGDRTIALIDQYGDSLGETTVYIPNGRSRVTLNFNVPAENNLQLGVQGTEDMFRDSSGAAFPYTLPGMISITGTNAGLPGYYYFFYDWAVQEPVCKSPRAPVNVDVITPAASFTFSTFGDSVVFTNHSTSTTSWIWFFGDGSNDTSTLENPKHVYAGNGMYEVVLLACNGSCCSDTGLFIPIVSTGIATEAVSNAIKVYPNPVNDNLQIVFGNAFQSGSSVLKLINSIGQMVIEQSLSPADMTSGYILNTSPFAKGIYTLVVESEQGRFVQKIVKE